MKTYNRLFQQICSFENLLNAARKAQRSKRFQAEASAEGHHPRSPNASFEDVPVFWVIP